jgi:hypothetical protein
MAETYRFFDAVEVGGVYDRAYNASEFAEYFSNILTNGYVNVTSNELKVVQDSGMDIEVNAGFAYINGRLYSNSAALSLTIETADAVNPRIDRIILRLDLNTANRYIKAFVLKGTAAASPTAAALTQDATIYEISLAQIAVAAGATSIITANITDERTAAASKIGGATAFTELQDTFISYGGASDKIIKVKNDETGLETGTDGKDFTRPTTAILYTQVYS